MSVRNSNYGTKTFHFPVIALTIISFIIGPSCLDTWAELSQNRSRVVSNWAELSQAELSVGRVV